MARAHPRPSKNTRKSPAPPPLPEVRRSVSTTSNIHERKPPDLNKFGRTAEHQKPLCTSLTHNRVHLARPGQMRAKLLDDRRAQCRRSSTLIVWPSNACQHGQRQKPRCSSGNRLLRPSPSRSRLKPAPQAIEGARFQQAPTPTEYPWLILRRVEAPATVAEGGTRIHHDRLRHRTAATHRRVSRICPSPDPPSKLIGGRPSVAASTPATIARLLCVGLPPALGLLDPSTPAIEVLPPPPALLREQMPRGHNTPAAVTASSATAVLVLLVARAFALPTVPRRSLSKPPANPCSVFGSSGSPPGGGSPANFRRYRSCPPPPKGSRLRGAPKIPTLPRRGLPLCWSMTGLRRSTAACGPSPDAHGASPPEGRPSRTIPHAGSRCCRCTSRSPTCWTRRHTGG